MNMEQEKAIELIMPPEGFLFSSFASNHYFTEILRGVLAVANLFEWDVNINHRVARDELYECSKQERIRGLVLLAPILDKKKIESIHKLEVPSIVVNARYPDLNYVDTNNKEGARQAVEHMIKLGHKKIAIINGLMDTTNAIDRFDGYKKALADNGISLIKELVKYGNFYEDSGYLEMKNLLEPGSGVTKEVPTAVFCANDLMAFGAIRAINEKGLKVPEDISVVGFNDHIISAYFTPPLTTVRQQLFHIGKEAMTTLISVISENKNKCQHVEIETRLIKRGSVASVKE